jgi:hypothetical protein
MKISSQPGYRTREITLSEFLSDYMKTKTTPNTLEPKDHQGNIIRPIIGFLTIYDMDRRPSMNSAFLFPDRFVYMYVNISNPLGIFEPYPNPYYQSIEIEERTECELERTGNYTNLVITWGSVAGTPHIYGLKKTKVRFSNGPEVDCFYRAFLQIRHHLSTNIPLPTNNVLDELGFERGYIIEESIQRFLKPGVEISEKEAIRLETAEKFHRSKKMAFTRNELGGWGDSFTRFHDYQTLIRKYQEQSKSEMAKISDIFYRDEENFALYMPITNREWAIKKADDVTRGCLVAAGRRFLIIDFDRKSSTFHYYEDFSGVELNDSHLTIHLHNRSSIVLSLKINMGRKITMQWLGIIHGMTDGFGEQKNNKFFNYLMVTDYLERNAQRMNLSQLFAVTIYSLFVNAMEITSS